MAGSSHDSTVRAILYAFLANLGIRRVAHQVSAGRQVGRSGDSGGDRFDNLRAGWYRVRAQHDNDSVWPRHDAGGQGKNGPEAQCRRRCGEYQCARTKVESPRAKTEMAICRARYSRLIALAGSRLVQMHILLREREGDVLLIKAFLDGLRQIEHDRPVVGRFHPWPNDEINAAVRKR